MPHRKGCKKDKDQVKLCSPKMKICSPHLKLHSPHLKIKSPHFKIKKKYSPIVARPGFQPRLFVNEHFGIIGTTEVLLQPGTSWRFNLPVRLHCDSDVLLTLSMTLKLILAAAAIPAAQVSPRESGIPEVLIEWFRGNKSLTNGRHVLYATDARLPETIWISCPSQKVDVDVDPGFHEYVLEITNNSDNCIVTIDHHSMSAAVFKSHGSIDN